MTISLARLRDGEPVAALMRRRKRKLSRSTSEARAPPSTRRLCIAPRRPACAAHARRAPSASTGAACALSAGATTGASWCRERRHQRAHAHREIEARMFERAVVGSWRSSSRLMPPQKAMSPSITHRQLAVQAPPAARRQQPPAVRRVEDAPAHAGRGPAHAPVFRDLAGADAVDHHAHRDAAPRRARAPPATERGMREVEDVCLEHHCLARRRWPRPSPEEPLAALSSVSSCSARDRVAVHAAKFGHQRQVVGHAQAIAAAPSSRSRSAGRGVDAVQRETPARAKGKAVEPRSRRARAEATRASAVELLAPVVEVAGHDQHPPAGQSWR